MSENGRSTRGRTAPRTRRGRFLPRIRRRPLSDPSRGFTLVELLVAIVILGFALLALGQVAWFAARTAVESYTSTRLSVQALDMGERMWLALPEPTEAVAAWTAAESGSLPGWSGTVTVVDATTGLYTISVATTALDHQYTLRLPVPETGP